MEYRSVLPAHIAESITVSTARKGIPQAALNRMGIAWGNVSRNRWRTLDANASYADDCPPGCVEDGRSLAENGSFDSFFEYYNKEFH